MTINKTSEMRSHLSLINSGFMPINKQLLS